MRHRVRTAVPAIALLLAASGALAQGTDDLEDTGIVDFKVTGFLGTQAFLLDGFEINPEGSKNTTEFARYVARARAAIQLGTEVTVLSRFSLLDGVVLGNQDEGTSILSGFGDATSETGRRGEDIEGFDIDRVWIEYTTDFGQFRIGRQPANWGIGLLANKGADSIEFGNDGNGPVGPGDTVDRVMAVTDVSQFAEDLFGQDNHLFATLAYDRVRDGDLGVGDDDLNHVVFALLYSNRPYEGVVGTQELGTYNVWVSQAETDTSVGVFNLYSRISVPYQNEYEIYVEAEAAFMVGDTTRAGVVDRSVRDTAEDFAASVFSTAFQSSGSPPGDADARGRLIAQRGTQSADEAALLEAALTEALIRDLFVPGESASELSRRMVNDGLLAIERDDIDVDAFAAIGRAGLRAGPLHVRIEVGASKDIGRNSVTPSVVLGLGGGRSRGVGEVSEAFLFGSLLTSGLQGERFSLLPIDPEHDPALILFEEVGPLGPDGRPAVTNAVYERLSAEYQVTDDWQVYLNIIVAQLARDVERFRVELDECTDPCEGARLIREKPSSDLGWEVDVGTWYAFNEWLKGEVKAGYLHTGEAFGSKADPVTAIKAQLVVELGE